MTNPMMDHLSGRQTSGLENANISELNAKMDAIASRFGIEWLSEISDNPLQVLWNSQDAMATNELLNFGDAIEGFEKCAPEWLDSHVERIKNGDEGNRAGSIFELLGLNFYLTAGNCVIPSSSSNPGFDGIVKLSNSSSLLVSIKNHGMTSYQKFFQRNAEELDRLFLDWLEINRYSGVELRVVCEKHLDADGWQKLKRDVSNILDGQLDGSAKAYRTVGKYHIILRNLTEHYPLSLNRISSVTFISAKAHKNE